MHQETELKFVGDQAALTSLRQSALFLELAGHRGASTVSRRAVYFDTRDHALRNAGYVLRVRGEGNVHYQTLKRIGTGELMTRPEYKSEVSGIAPDPGAIPDSRARWRITHLVSGQALEPIFEVDTRRTRVLLSPSRNVEVEASIDTGEIRLASDLRRTLPISEVEFELVRGGMGDLLSVARNLTQGLPLTLSFLSKPERGFRLAAGEMLDPCRSTRINLRGLHSADDAVACIMGHCLRHLLNNMDAVMVGRHPEGIHQMRVALRKLRVAFSLLTQEQRAILDGLIHSSKAIANALGASRDTEILLSDLTLPVARKLGREGEFVGLVRHLEQMREQTLQAAVDCLSSEAFRVFVVELAAATQQRPWLSVRASHGAMQADVRRFSSKQLVRRMTQCRKAVRRADKLKPEELHDLRIRLKKLRYTLEFFESVEDRKERRRLIKTVIGLQDVLGEMNDILVARQQLRTMISQSRAGEDAHSFALAGGMLLGWHGRRYVAKRRCARRCISELARSKAFRKQG